jgi:NitT/TauT family transport system substrate-binding protein
MEKIEIQFTLFSAFYSPLIAVMAGGFLEEEDIEATWSISPPGVSAIAALIDGTAQVIQTAPSQAFSELQTGKVPEAVHFAQINEMDGFFLTGREPEPNFDWKSLEGARVISFNGGQPRAMFQYACFKAGIDFSKIELLAPGSVSEMDKAFRGGLGDYIHQQGPFPQQLENDGVGHIVSLCGPIIGPNAFSSVAATGEWLSTDVAKSFTRAYGKTRVWMNETSANDIAHCLHPFFPETDLSALSRCIETYQNLGCWTPHLEITEEALDRVYDVFEHFGTLKERFSWDSVCSAPPI